MILKKRNYQQFCPLAYSLDIIGDRWTLLIVRELSLGSRRFSDIQRGLPGIGPNLLSTRLKELEQSAIIERVHMPPPANVTAYSLTERGRSLLQAMMPLAQWGIQFLQMPPPEGDFLSAVAGVGAIHLMFMPEMSAGISAEIHFPPDVFSLTSTNGDLAVTQGTAVNPDLIIETSTKTLFGVLSQMMSLDAAIESGRLILKQGDKVVLERFVQQFGAPIEAVG